MVGGQPILLEGEARVMSFPQVQSLQTFKVTVVVPVTDFSRLYTLALHHHPL